MNRILIAIILITACTLSGFTQIGINNPNPDTTSILDLTSTSQGLLVPRMSTFQRRAITSPANALLVFDTDETMFYYNDEAYGQGTPTDWTALSPFKFRDNLNNFDIPSGLYLRDVYTIPSFRYFGLGTQTPLNTLSVSGNASIGDSTETAAADGLYVKGQVDFDDDLNVTENVKADTVSANVLVGYGSIPTGGIIMWSGSSIPDGWILCDGSTILDTESPMNGSATPNLTDRFIVGSGSSYAIGATGGENTHTLTTNEMPSHNHGVTDPGHTHTVSDRYFQGGNSFAAANLGSDNRENHTETRTTSSRTTGISINNTGGGNAHENRPPYYALAFIMRTK